jgi:hypothetical protein
MAQPVNGEDSHLPFYQYPGKEGVEPLSELWRISVKGEIVRLARMAKRLIAEVFDAVGRPDFLGLTLTYAQFPSATCRRAKRE